MCLAFELCGYEAACCCFICWACDKSTDDDEMKEWMKRRSIRQKSKRPPVQKMQTIIVEEMLGEKKTQN